MASLLRKLKQKTTKTSPGKADNTAHLKPGFKLSSSGSSPIESICNLFEEEPVIEPSSESGSGKISPSYSAAVTAIADPGTRMRFRPVVDELLHTVEDSRFFPFPKRSVSESEAIQSKVTSEPTRRAASCVEDREPLIVEQEREDSSQFLGSDEPADLEFNSRQNSDEDPPLVPYRTLKQRYIYYSTCFVNSFFIVPFLLLLVGFGCLNCYMGFKNFGKCQFMNNLPFLMVLMGASGVAGISSRIIFILTKKRWFTQFEVCRCVTFAAVLTFTISYILEFLFYSLNKGHPSSEKGSGYCQPFFYDYVYWYNWAVLGTIITLAVLHGPNSCKVQ